MPPKADISYHWFNHVPVLREFQEEPYREWKTALEDGFEVVALDNEAKRIQVIKIKTAGKVRLSLKQLANAATYDEVIAHLEKLALPDQGAERQSLLSELMEYLPPAGASLKHIITDIDNIIGKSDRLGIALPMDLFSHAVLRVMKRDAALKQLAVFFESTHDLTDYGRLRTSVLRVTLPSSESAPAHGSALTPEHAQVRTGNAPAPTDISQIIAWMGKQQSKGGGTTNNRPIFDQKKSCFCCGGNGHTKPFCRHKVGVLQLWEEGAPQASVQSPTKARTSRSWARPRAWATAWAKRHPGISIWWSKYEATTGGRSDGV